MQEKFWDRFQSWHNAERAWEVIAEQAKTQCVLNVPACTRCSPSIARSEHFLRWKAFRWILRKDRGYRLLRILLRHPFRYGWRYVRSRIKTTSYTQDGDFFFYGLKRIDELYAFMQQEQAFLIIGFSYCEKPHECPCGRFNEDCHADLNSLVCQQCFIAKVMHALPHCKTVSVIIPTINALGARVLEVITGLPNKKIFFIITACELALEMFGDFGNMVDVRGVGIRLGGRVCHTMRGFALSEEGIKAGLTVVLPSAQHRVLELVRFWREVAMQDTCDQDDTKESNENSLP